MNTYTFNDVLDKPLGSMVLENVVAEENDLLLTIVTNDERFNVVVTFSEPPGDEFVEALRDVCPQEVDFDYDEGEPALMTLEQKDGEWIPDCIFGFIL